MGINQGVIDLRRHWDPNKSISTFPNGLLALAACGQRLAQENVPVNFRHEFVPKFLLPFGPNDKVLFSWK